MLIEDSEESCLHLVSLLLRTERHFFGLQISITSLQDPSEILRILYLRPSEELLEAAAAEVGGDVGLGGLGLHRRRGERLQLRVREVLRRSGPAMENRHSPGQHPAMGGMGWLALKCPKTSRVLVSDLPIVSRS